MECLLTCYLEDKYMINMNMINNCILSYFFLTILYFLQLLLFFSFVHFLQSSEIFLSWTLQVLHGRRARPFLSHLSNSSFCVTGKWNCQSANQDACKEQEAEGTSEMRDKSSKKPVCVARPWSDYIFNSIQ